ncbi:hypothetical protein Lfu02_47320 [Longispora fulva]|uniref:Uncharacterized protein n=1 Tax=Longispora fulva TaxID=619741 RepID=A0A8J7KXN8_9ACTN|nr:hypothetical protein [Longispora fulva]MBG6138107.1 hypothetical protein [Longispora fulva]GIG60360.1 hypothetical protein Lfu02_47320 [Longispora fulva]
MALRDQLTDPWGILAAGLVGGLGGAVTAATVSAGVGVGLGVAVAAAVYGVRVGLGVAFEPRATRPAQVPFEVRKLPRPPKGSVAARWLDRAEGAAAALRRQVDGEPDPVLRSQISQVDEGAASVLTDLARFAGQVTLLAETAARIDAAALRDEYEALTFAAQTGPASLREERQRAAQAVSDQIDSHRRLTEAQETLLVRMQAAVLGLEGLVVRLAELSTMHAASDVAGDTSSRVRLLTEDLDGLRSGLADAEALSRQVLAGEPPPGG